MTDEKRLERLTQLARKAWPDRPTAHAWFEVDYNEAGVSYEPSDPEHADQLSSIRHPNALDALEAALLVLNGPEALREFAFAVVAREGVIEKAVAAERERVCAILEDAWGEDTGGPMPSNFSEAIDKLRAGT